MKGKELADLLRNQPHGTVTVAGVDQLHHYKLKEFIAQPTEFLLYDLNRDDATCLTLLQETGDLVWVNNYACAQVIRALKNRIDELEGEIK